MNPVIKMPAVRLHGLVVFPNMILHFDVGRDDSIKAIEAAIEGGCRIFLVTDEEITNADGSRTSIVSEIGVVAEIRQKLITPDGSVRVLVQGLYRARFLTFAETEPYTVMRIRECPPMEDTLTKTERTAYLRKLRDGFKAYAEASPRMPEELYKDILRERDLLTLIDKIVFNIFLKTEDKQKLLECGSVKKRTDMLIKKLAEEVSIVEMEQEISDDVKAALERNHREAYLREQLKVISGQLGEGESDDGYEYIHKIRRLGFDKDITEKLIGECNRMNHLPPTSQEAAVIRTYLDEILALPWGVYTDARTDIAKAEKQLNGDHYGLEKVKERILETIAVNQWEKSDKKGQIICLVGPPGVGKTSIGKSVAAALGRNFARVSLGGVKDEADIRGHRKTYVGAMPGRIAYAIKQAKSMNPVLLFDEIDKMANDHRGDPSSAMLEVLDAEQNKEFRDHYLEIPMDLSDVLFITTANTLDTIAPPLLDRMEVIELGSYTREEKFNIAKKHLIPKQYKKYGITKSNLSITDSAVYEIIDSYTKEAGVRKLERYIAKLCRMSIKKLLEENTKKVTIKSANIGDFLGVRKYIGEQASKQDEVGAVNGLAWTSAGGVLMPLEVLVLDGDGKIEVTGSLGDVMKESVKLAISVARSVASKYEIDDDFYKKKDIHIHAPEGAVPKDGPSAGITITTALVSALSGFPVRHDIAMTGEITLRGKVLAIGGLREKTMAAYKAGIKTVIIPKDNEADMTELDKVILDSIDFVVTDNIRTVLDTALVRINTSSRSMSDVVDNAGSVENGKVATETVNPAATTAGGV